MMTRGLWVVVLTTILSATFVFFSCEDGGGSEGKSAGSDTETGDTDSNDDGPAGPACQVDGGDLGQPCDKEHLCDCDHICGYQAFGDKLDGGETVTNYCFERCSPDAPQCEPNYACVPRPGERSLCLPAGRITAEQFEAKVFTPAAQATAADSALDQNITGSLGGVSFNGKNAAVGVYDPKTKIYHFAVVMGAQGGYSWTLDLKIPKKKWTPGQWKVGGFYASLFLSGGKPPRLWYEADAVRGTLDIEAAPEPCQQGGDTCEPMRGSFDLELLGMHTEIKASQETKR